MGIKVSTDLLPKLPWVSRVLLPFSSEPEKNNIVNIGFSALMRHDIRVDFGSSERRRSEDWTLVSKQGKEAH